LAGLLRTPKTWGHRRIPMSNKSKASLQDESADEASLATDELNLAEEVELEEELSPFDPDSDDQPVLFVQVLDRNFVPLVGVQVLVSGSGMPEVRSLITDADGIFLIEDCGPGVYELSCAGAQARVHTLTQHDLELDDAAYRVVLASSLVAPSEPVKGSPHV
jgi:hypothetical protein